MKIQHFQFLMTPIDVFKSYYQNVPISVIFFTPFSIHIVKCFRRILLRGVKFLWKNVWFRNNITMSWIILCFWSRVIRLYFFIKTCFSYTKDFGQKLQGPSKGPCDFWESGSQFLPFLQNTLSKKTLKIMEDFFCHCCTLPWLQDPFGSSLTSKWNPNWTLRCWF